MKKAEGVIAWVSRVFNNIGMVFLTFLMLVITADVLLRDIFNRPLRGANEIAEFSMLLVVFLSVAFTQYVKSNIAVSILYDRFPKAAQLSFIAIGPMVDLKLIMMYAGVFRRRSLLALVIIPTVIVYVVSVVLGTIVG